jgi:hypothetical protein
MPAQNRKELKTFLMSGGALNLNSRPGIIVEREEREGLLVCRVDEAANPEDPFPVAFAHFPQLLTQFEKADAHQKALWKLREFLLPEDGWTNHFVILIEIPRSSFIKMQLFTSIKEIFHRALVVAGFGSG